MRYYQINNNVDKKISIGKIVCLARTYHKHAIEMNASETDSPLIFLKPASSVIFSDEAIVIPPQSNCLNHEVELGVVIGKTCSKVKSEDVLDYVLGYLVGLDITARDIQSIAKKNGWPWTLAKGFDTFAPLSNVVLADKVSNPNDLNLELFINDELKQNVNTSFLIWSVEEIISYVSGIMTLEVGDLILTGTPEGVGEIKNDDVLVGKLNDLCEIKVHVTR